MLKVVKQWHNQTVPLASSRNIYCSHQANRDFSLNMFIVILRSINTRRFHTCLTPNPRPLPLPDVLSRRYAMGNAGCWSAPRVIRPHRADWSRSTFSRQSLARVQQVYPFAIHAWVVLPDHLHCILSLPEGDSDFPLRWRLIKSHFSRALPMTERRSQTRIRHGERGIWQRHYWEHLIRDEEDSPYGLRPYQPTQAWLCHAGGRLALLHLPPLRGKRRLSAGMVRVG